MLFDVSHLRAEYRLRVCGLDLGIDGRIILIFIIEGWGVEVQAEFSLHRTISLGKLCVFLTHGNKSCGISVGHTVC